MVAVLSDGGSGSGADATDDTTIHPWTVTASRIVHRDRWITLRADDCCTHDGHVIAPYYVVDYPDWVVIVALDTADRLVLVEQYRHGLRVASTELPGGGVDPGEAPIDAARRELIEETGYAGGEARIVTVISPNPSNHSNRCHVVLIRGVRRIAAPVDHPGERARTHLVAVDDAVALAMRGGMIQAMHVAGLTLGLSTIGLWRPAPVA